VSQLGQPFAPMHDAWPLSRPPQTLPGRRFVSVPPA